MGQIYIPRLNWLLMLCTIGLVVGFRSSNNLSAAYGMAVTSTMLITTLLFTLVARKKWGWTSLAVFPLAGIFLMGDIAFFSANVSKIIHGAWFPLLIGTFFFVLMHTWEQKREELMSQFKRTVPTFDNFMKTLETDSVTRINGQAIFLVDDEEMVPAPLIQNLKHNRVLHSENAFLYFKTANIPRVPNFEKVKTEKLGGGFYRITATYGYMEEPNVANALALARATGAEFKVENASFYVMHYRLTLGAHPKMGRWQSNLFIFTLRNATDAATSFNIPSDQIIEIGVQLEL
jgi:KUP system potassium uptake protein